MNENQNEHYEINVFLECNVHNVIFRFLFTRLGKGRGNSNWFPYYGDIANLRNRILNIDQ